MARHTHCAALAAACQPWRRSAARVFEGGNVCPRGSVFPECGQRARPGLESLGVAPQAWKINVESVGLTLRDNRLRILDA